MTLNYHWLDHGSVEKVDIDVDQDGDHNQRILLVVKTDDDTSYSFRITREIVEDLHKQLGRFWL